MMHLKTLVLLILSAASTFAQGLAAEKLLQQPIDTWPTYNGDYSGRRFSPLTKINDGNVTSLTLAWAYRLSAGAGGAGRIDQGNSTHGQRRPLLHRPRPRLGC